MRLQYPRRSHIAECGGSQQLPFLQRPDLVARRGTTTDLGTPLEGGRDIGTEFRDAIGRIQCVDDERAVRRRTPNGDVGLSRCCRHLRVTLREEVMSRRVLTPCP